MIAGRALHSLLIFELKRCHLVAALLLTSSVSCGGSVSTTTYGLECETGTLGCSCYGNWSCNYQLSCVENECIDRKNQTPPAKQPSDVQAGKDQPEDPELMRAESLADPLAAAASDECVTCIHTECSTPLQGCYPETGCIALQACLLKCTDQDPPPAACSNDCFAAAPANAQLKSTPVSECTARSCTACQTAS